MTHSTPRGSEGERAAVKQVATPVPVLGRLVDNLEQNISVGAFIYFLSPGQKQEICSRQTGSLQ